MTVVQRGLDLEAAAEEIAFMNRKQRRAAAKVRGAQLAGSTRVGARDPTRDIYIAALDHHRAGRLSQAQIYYRRVLAAQPKHADAMHLLGVVAHELGENTDAIELIRKAIELHDPSAG